MTGALFGSKDGIHLAWIGHRFYPEGKIGDSLEETAPWLIVTTVSDLDVTHRAYELLPDGILYPDGSIYSVAGRADGLVAVGYSWNENKQDRPQAALLRVGEAAPFVKLALPVDGNVDDIALQTAAGWDGEAFAMHAYGAPPQFTLHVARLDVSGNVVLPFTRYGETPSVGYGPLGHKTSTSAESGRTYVLDSALDQLLSGHLRDGSRLPGTEDGPKALKANGIPMSEGTALAVAADTAGGWVAWEMTPGGNPVVPVQRIDLDGNPVGAPAKPSIFVAKGDTIQRWFLLSHETSVVMFGASLASIHYFTYDGTTLSGPVRVLEGGEWGDIDPREMMAIDWNGETWLAYLQASNAVHMRLLKIAPGCTYPANPPGVPTGPP